MIGVGLVGYGLAGRVFHAPYIAATPGLVLKAIASRRAEDAGRAWPGARICTPQALIAAPDVDLVVLATPNESHLPLGLAAIAAGKALVIDKPMAVSVAEARRLIETAEVQGTLLTMFHNRRWDDDFLTLSDLVREGAIGELATLDSRFDRFRPKPSDGWRERPGAGGGVWWDLGPHLVDQALQLMGPPEAITADLARQRPGAQVDDYAHVTLHYGARRAILRAGCLVSSAHPRLAAEGRAGSFLTQGLDPQEQRLRNPGAPEAERIGVLCAQGADGALAETRVPLTPGDYGAFYRLTHAAMDSGAPPPVTPQQALLVMQVIETAIASASQRRTLPL